MKAKTPIILVLSLIFALVLCSAVSAGTPLAENQTGTVSGDLYVNTTDGWPSSTQGATNIVTQANTLPTYTSIDSAWVYVNVYSGSGSNNWPVRTIIKLDGNGDGDYDDAGETLGVEDMNIAGSPDGTVYWLNDHCNRVYSDYQVWYNITSLITSNNPTLYVKTENMGGDGYDGRIKLLALCVAYNDGDTDQVDYWVLNGQDWINAATSPSTSTFNTSSFNGLFSSATLNTVALASTDGTYTLNGKTKTSNITETGAYYKENSWDVTNDITAGVNSTLTYANVGSSLKLNLATLAIREEPAIPPVAEFTSDTTSGFAPLTVHFTNISTGTINTYQWDFDNNGTTDSTNTNPTWTYTNAGTYTVNLTVTGPGGTDTETKTNYIAVIPENYITYLGGTGDDRGQFGIIMDNAGNVYITGYTASTNFPTTTGAYQTTYGGGTFDAFLSKFNSGGELVYSTYIGGSGNDRGFDVALDNDGNIYLTGSAVSTNFPLTSGAYQTSNGGSADVFLAKFNSSGQLIYSSYLGATGSDVGYGIAVDSSGNIYLTGSTDSTVTSSDPTKKNFPTTSGAYQTSNAGPGSNDAFLSIFNSGGGLVYSTYLGGNQPDIAYDIELDGDENIYLTGYARSANFPTTPGAYQTVLGGNGDVFLSKFNSSGGLVYSTYLGGSGLDYGYGIALDSAGNIYLTGNTPSANFPTTTDAYQTSYGGGSYDAFLSKFNSSGGLVYSTYLGGSGLDYGYGIALDSAGNIYLTGNTASTIFPTTNDAYQTSYGGGSYDAFLSKFNSDGGLVYSTYLGATGNDIGYDIKVDTTGKIYLTGYTASTNFPTTTGAYQTTYGGGSYDAFLVKLKLSAAADIEAPTVTANPASGTYTAATQVTLTATDNIDSNPFIYYTINGSDPNTNSTQYNGPITFYTTNVLKFIAVDASGNISQVQTETYTINDTQAPTVTSNPAGGTYTAATQVILTATDNIGPNPAIYYTIDSTEPTISSTQYTGPVSITSTATLKFIAIDLNGNTSSVQTENYILIDTEAPTVNATQNGTTVTLSATDNADPNPAIYYTTDESDPTTSSTLYNGSFSIPQYAITVVKFIAADASGNTSPVQSRTFSTYTGDPWTGGRYCNGIDLETQYYAEGNIGLVISNGGTSYGWFAYNTPGTGTATYSNLNIPADATILTARLYQAWTWYGYPGYTLTFNGYDVTPAAQYTDGLDGQNVYDVTTYFNATNDNTAVLTASGSGASYATILMVVYQSRTEPYRKIWIDEGFDILYHNPATGYAMFDNVTTNNMASAQITTILPSGETRDGQNILFNGQTINRSSMDGSDPSYNFYNVTNTIQNGTNEMGINGESYFSLQNAILTITMQSAPLAQFTADTTNGIASLTVHFTETSTNATGWSWDFDNNGTTDSTDTNPVWTYNTPGTYTVKLTATGPGGSDEETKTNYITVSGTPDLVTSDLQIPSNPIIATSYPVSATVTNSGNGDATSFTVKLYDNNTQVAKATLTSLASLASTPVSFTWTPTTTGTHVLAVIADANNEITESDETNNLVSAQITVNPSTQPDLMATNLMLPVSPVIGTTSPVTVTITNQGTVDSSAFVVKLYDNNTQYATINLTGLAAGANTDITFDWLTYTTGAHNLSIITDANQQITEYNETNNQISQQATVSQSTIPDLIVTNLQLPANPTVAISSQVTATVSNNGTVDSGAFVVKLYDNNTQIAKINLTGLAAGVSTDVTFNWLTYTAGAHNLSVIADANQQITEYNENNNQISQAVTVNPSTQPDLTVTDLQLPSNPVAGTAYQITATVTNLGTVDTGAFAVKLYDNNTQLGKINITSLAAGTSTQVTFNWTPITGTHNLAIKADANNQITEYNENNNTITQQVTVS